MRTRSMERGMALVAALLLLLVVTMLGVGMFRSFGLQEHIAGNTRERQRALAAAGDAQSYAEWWLTANKGANAQVGVDCASMGIPTIPQICTTTLPNPTNLPWSSYVSYTPLGMSVVGTGGITAGTIDAYASAPGFYITWLSGFYDKQSGASVNNYLIDASGYAGTTSAAAVVESSFTVTVTYTAQTSNTKFVSLGGQ